MSGSKKLICLAVCLWMCCHLYCTQYVEHSVAMKNNIFQLSSACFWIFRGNKKKKKKKNLLGQKLEHTCCLLVVNGFPTNISKHNQIRNNRNLHQLWNRTARDEFFHIKAKSFWFEKFTRRYHVNYIQLNTHRYSFENAIHYGQFNRTNFVCLSREAFWPLKINENKKTFGKIGMKGKPVNRWWTCTSIWTRAKNRVQKVFTPFLYMNLNLLAMTMPGVSARSTFCPLTIFAMSMYIVIDKVAPFDRNVFTFHITHSACTRLCFETSNTHAQIVVTVVAAAAAEPKSHRLWVQSMREKLVDLTD